MTSTGPASHLELARGAVQYHQHGARPQQATSDVPFHRWIAQDGRDWARFYRRGPDGYLVRFPDLADFEISCDGTSAEGWAAPTAHSPATIEHLYLNQVAPLALSRQGKLVLHASAIEVGEFAIAFIGESGRGKSTLAASFAGAGRHFLTDDGLQLAWDGQALIAQPSHPSIRLWDDSQRVLASATNRPIAAVDFSSKARFLAGPDFPYCPHAKPLRHIYFLGQGKVRSITIEPLRSSSATLIELVRNSFLLDIAEQEQLARHFDEISRIAALPLHYHLDYPRRYEDLPRVREAVLQHANAKGH